MHRLLVTLGAVYWPRWIWGLTQDAHNCFGAAFHNPWIISACNVWGLFLNSGFLWRKKKKMESVIHLHKCWIHVSQTPPPLQTALWTEVLLKFHLFQSQLIKVTLSYNNGLFAAPESESYWLMQSLLFKYDVFFWNNCKREETRVPVPLPLQTYITLLCVYIYMHACMYVYAGVYVYIDIQLGYLRNVLNIIYIILDCKITKL